MYFNYQLQISPYIPILPPNSCRWAHPPISSFSRLYLTTRDWWKSPFHHQLHSRADGEIHSTPGATILAFLQVTIMVNPKVSWNMLWNCCLNSTFWLLWSEFLRVNTMYPKFTVVIYGCALYTKITLSMVNVRYRTKQHTIAKADIPKKRSTVIIMTIKFSWLVVSTPPKNMKVKWDYYSQYMET